jgi:serine phosphatase RsbU (regulator of sigma subunit)
MPLGLLPGMSYEQKETTIAPGESVLFYSDGIVEAHNPLREMFGSMRLQTALMKQAQDGSGLIDGLLDELFFFTGVDREQEDDVTLLTIQRSAGGKG